MLIREPEFKKLNINSENFLYEGKDAARKKRYMGRAGAAASGAVIAAEIVFFPLLIADVTLVQGAGIRGLFKTAADSLSYAQEGVDRQGRCANGYSRQILCFAYSS